MNQPPNQGYYTQLLQSDNPMGYQPGGSSANIVSMPEQDYLPPRQYDLGRPFSSEPRMVSGYETVHVQTQAAPVAAHAQSRATPLPSINASASDDGGSVRDMASGGEVDSAVTWQQKLELVNQLLPNQAEALVGEAVPPVNAVCGQSLFSSLTAQDTEETATIGLKWSPSIINAISNSVQPKMIQKYDAKSVNFLPSKVNKKFYSMVGYPDNLKQATVPPELDRVLPDLARHAKSAGIAVAARNVTSLEETARAGLAAMSHADIFTSAAFAANKLLLEKLEVLLSVTMPECLEMVRDPNQNPLAAIAELAEQVEALLTSSAKAGEVAMYSSVANVSNLVLAQRSSIIESLPESVPVPIRFELATADFSQAVLSGKDHLFGQSAAQAVIDHVREEASIQGPFNKIMTIVKRASDAPFRARGSAGASRPSGRGGPRSSFRGRVSSSTRGRGSRGRESGIPFSGRSVSQSRPGRPESAVVPP